MSIAGWRGIRRLMVHEEVGRGVLTCPRHRRPGRQVPSRAGMQEGPIRLPCHRGQAVYFMSSWENIGRCAHACQHRNGASAWPCCGRLVPGERETWQQGTLHQSKTVCRNSALSIGTVHKLPNTKLGKPVARIKQRMIVNLHMLTGGA